MRELVLRLAEENPGSDTGGPRVSWSDSVTASARLAQTAVMESNIMAARAGFLFLEDAR